MNVLFKIQSETTANVFAKVVDVVENLAANYALVDFSLVSTFQALVRCLMLLQLLDTRQILQAADFAIDKLELGIF